MRLLAISTELIIWGMTRTVGMVLGGSLAMLGAFATACAKDSAGPAASDAPPLTASLRVELVGWGNARDPDGFQIVVGPSEVTVPWNDAAVFEGLPPSLVTVRLNGVAAHCSADTSSHSVTLTAGRTDTVRFAVGCFGDFAFGEQLPDLDWRLRYLDTLGTIRPLGEAPGRQVGRDWSPSGDRI